MRMRSALRSVAIGTLLVSGMAACSNNSVNSDALELRVTIVDDAGAPVDRTRFTVSSAGESVGWSRTNARGEGTVSVPDAGTYEVLVTPRTGYLGGSDPLRKQVRVNGSGSVEFRVFREAVGEDRFSPCAECQVR